MSSIGEGGGGYRPGFEEDPHLRGGREEEVEQREAQPSSGGWFSGIRGWFSSGNDSSSVSSVASGALAAGSGPAAETPKTVENRLDDHISYTRDDFLNYSMEKLSSVGSELKAEAKRLSTPLQERIGTFAREALSSLSEAEVSKIRQEVTKAIESDFADIKFQFSAEGKLEKITDDEGAEIALLSGRKELFEQAFEQIFLTEVARFAIEEKGARETILFGELKDDAFHLGRVKLELALAQWSHEENFGAFGNYGIDYDGALAAQLTDYEGAFLNKEDIAKAKSAVEGFQANIDAALKEIGEGKIPSTGSPYRFIAPLYNAFFLDPDTGKTREEMGETRPPSDAVIKEWVQSLEGVAKMRGRPPLTSNGLIRDLGGTLHHMVTGDGGRHLTPIERRKLAIYDLVVAGAELQGKILEFSQHHVALDDGQKVAIGTNHSLKLDNGLEVSFKMDEIGTISVKNRDGSISQYEMGGEDVQLRGGYKLILSGDRPVLEYPAGKTFEPEPPRTVLQSRSASMGFSLQPQGFETIYHESYERNLDSLAGNIEALQDNLALYQGRIKVEEGLYAGGLGFDTRTEVLREEKRVQVELHDATDAQKSEVKSGLEKMQEAHMGVLGSVLGAAEQRQMIQDLEALGIEKVRRANLTNPSLAGQTVDFFKGALGAAWKGIYPSKSNSETIRDLKTKISQEKKSLAALKRRGASEASIAQKEVAIKKEEQKLIWYQKDSLIKVAQQLHDAIGTNNAVDFDKRPDAVALQERLDSNHKEILLKLRDLEKAEAAGQREIRELQLSFDGGSPLTSLASIASFGASMLQREIGDYWYQQATVEELSMRKELADAGYDFSREVRSAIKSIGKTLTGECGKQEFEAALKTELKGMLSQMYDKPELAARLVADLSQIKSILAGDSAAETLISRIRMQALAKAGFTGVPEEKAQKELSPQEKAQQQAELRKFQALCDLAKMAVPMMGALEGGARGNIVSKLTQGIPIIGPAASVVTGALYGAFSQDAIRYATNRMGDETKEQVSSVFAALREGPKGYLKAQSEFEMARIAGNTCKAFIDEGNFFTAVAKRFTQGVRFVINRQLGAVTNMIRGKDVSSVDKAVGVVGLAAPVAGIGLGAASLVGAVALGPLAPLPFVLLGAFYAVSSYARVKGFAKSILQAEQKAEIKQTEKKLRKNPEAQAEITRTAKQLLEAEKRYDQHHEALTGLYKVTVDDVDPEQLHASIAKLVEQHPERFASFKKRMEQHQEGKMERVTEQEVQREFYKEILKENFYKERLETLKLETRQATARILVEREFDEEALSQLSSACASKASTVKSTWVNEAAGKQSFLSPDEFALFAKEAAAAAA